MKPTNSIYILLSLFLISNCGDKVREEITERYDDGKKKTIMKFVGEGSEEVMVEKVTYGKGGDTLYWEKPLEDFYYEKIREEITERYDDGKKKTIMKFKGSGSEEVMVEKISYSQSGDTLILEKPLDKLKMVRVYYENGKIRSEKNYKDGQEDCKYTKYFTNGKISEEGNYKGVDMWGDGQEDGKYTEYFTNGKIKREGNYKDRRKDGKWTDYYRNGQIEEEGNYKDRRKDGKWTHYYENGQIEEEGNYKDRRKDGKWTDYYRNGQIKKEGNYKDRRKDGKWTDYNEDGSINKVEEYKDGELVK